MPFQFQFAGWVGSAGGILDSPNDQEPLFHVLGRKDIHLAVTMIMVHCPQLNGYL
jgi:hypothetical protein